MAEVVHCSKYTRGISSTLSDGSHSSEIVKTEWSRRETCKRCFSFVHFTVTFLILKNILHCFVFGRDVCLLVHGVKRH